MRGVQYPGGKPAILAPLRAAVAEVARLTVAAKAGRFETVA